jgi:hypothetical protein
MSLMTRRAGRGRAIPDESGRCPNGVSQRSALHIGAIIRSMEAEPGTRAAGGSAAGSDQPSWCCRVVDWCRRNLKPWNVRWWTNVLAGEFFLKVWPNGGTAIFVRTLWIASLMYTSALLVRAVGYTDWSLGVDWHKLREEVAATTTWLGAIAGAVYTALYARFSSQWNYLANVYHQMKGAIVSGPNKPGEEQELQISYWKAAFVEDAQDLHLVRKKMFAMTAWEWLGEEAVAEKFDLYTVGGRQRRVRLQKRLRRELLKQDSSLQLKEVDDAPAPPDAVPPAPTAPPPPAAAKPEHQPPNRGS